jgi:hypothetical protein
MSGTPVEVSKNCRRAYAKPVIKQVQLKPEEAVLGFCKAAATRGPNAGNCTSPTNCSALGS